MISRTELRLSDVKMCVCVFFFLFTIMIKKLAQQNERVLHVDRNQRMCNGKRLTIASTYELCIKFQ